MPLYDHYAVGERERGFKQALQDYGLPYDPDYMLMAGPIGDKSQEIEQDIEYLLTMPNRPDGIVAYNDMIATQIIKNSPRYGLKIPDDLLVTGFDDADISSCISPTVTTARCNAKLLGKAAMTAVCEFNQSKRENNFITGKVIIRESSVLIKDPVS